MDMVQNFGYCFDENSTGSYLLDMSSSSPPQPQNAFEKPFTVRNCLTVIAETPPNMVL